MAARITPAADAGLPCVGTSAAVLQTHQAAKPLRGLEACCRGGEGSGELTRGSSIPCPPLSHSQGEGLLLRSPAALLGGLSPACETCWRDGCKLPRELMKGRGSFLQRLGLHGMVAPASGASSVTLLSVGHGKAWCLPKNPTGIWRQRWSLPSASSTLGSPPLGTALLYF